MIRSNSLVRRTAVSLAVLVTGAALTWGQVPEPALHTPATDPTLAWGPCPAIMPAGCQIAVLHGDPARPNADVFLKLPAKSSFTKHKHTSAERMILLSGELAPGLALWLILEDFLHTSCLLLAVRVCVEVFLSFSSTGEMKSLLGGHKGLSGLWSQGAALTRDV